MEETFLDSLYLCWQNLKMRISHPRFLNIAAQEVMDSEFPTYMKNQAKSSRSCTQSDAFKTVETVFQFPEVDALCLCVTLYTTSSLGCVMHAINFSFLICRTYQILGKHRLSGPFGLGLLLLEAFHCT